MVDASGPGQYKQCTTTGLANLGDTDGFGEPGVEDKLYGLQLSDGIYKRKEITFKLPAVDLPSLEDLSNVDISEKVPNTRNHFVLLDNGSWVLLPVIRWLVDIRLAPPYVLSGRSHTIKKIINTGTMLASYTPWPKKDLLLRRVGHANYCLSPRGGSKPASLHLITEFKEDGVVMRVPPVGSTIYLELMLLKRQDAYVSILDGLKIRWSAKLENQTIGVIIKISEVGQQHEIATTIEPGVRFEQSVTISLAQLFIEPYIRLRRLMFYPSPLPTSYLKVIARDILMQGVV